MASQRTRLHSFAKDKDIEIVKEFDNDGFERGTIHKRPGFIEMLQFLEGNEVDFLLVTFIHRIGRFKKLSDRKSGGRVIYRKRGWCLCSRSIQWR
ncbi:MAG: recombinase family protein [Deltaproteobacteria bacterium]|nr:MAG: recombinase family protein [Deltaproteobacteria bacterium]